VVAGAALLPQVPVSAMPQWHGAELRLPSLAERLAQAQATAPPAAPVGHTALSAATPTLVVPLASSPAPGGKGVALPAAPVRPGAQLPAIARPVPPAALAAPVVALPVAPTAPTTAMRPITAPTPPAPIASR